MTPERTFNQGLDDLLAEIRALMLRKQHDYGPSNIMDTPIARLAAAWDIPGMDADVAGPQLGIFVRLNDKMARLYEGFKNGGETKVIGEALRDTWLDVVGYGLIALMVDNGTFTDTLVDEVDIGEIADAICDSLNEDSAQEGPVVHRSGEAQVVEEGMRHVAPGTEALTRVLDEGPRKIEQALGSQRKLECGHAQNEHCMCNLRSWGTMPQRWEDGSLVNPEAWADLYTK